MRPPADHNNKKPSDQRRRYESPLRQQQAAQTRESIIAAGAAITHQLASWDWRALTFRAVGERAGVSERTVHRHFATERQLREAIIQRLVEESGVALDHLELDEFAGVSARIYEYLSSFSVRYQPPSDPSFVALDQQRRRLLLDAVANAAQRWPESDREIAAAMLDMLWHPPLYERLSAAWQFDTGRATRAIAWMIGLVEQAIREDRRPGDGD
ncbi:MAG TPA: TetR/AcrR family transcriptional regulator [Solimonas sp.]|nr:TetR/AcrR family transcriptional regulator [Solimonas sp.]